nr:hypothetical protein Iba_chr05dCG12480 [Ipomoea batatas]
MKLFTPVAGASGTRMQLPMLLSPTSKITRKSAMQSTNWITKLIYACRLHVMTSSKALGIFWSTGTQLGDELSNSSSCMQPNQHHSFIHSLLPPPRFQGNPMEQLHEVLCLTDMPNLVKTLDQQRWTAAACAGLDRQAPPEWELSLALGVKKKQICLLAASGGGWWYHIGINTACDVDSNLLVRRSPQQPSRLMPELLRGRQPEFRPARIPGLKQVISLRALKVGVVVPELVAKVATGSLRCFPDREKVERMNERTPSISGSMWSEFIVPFPTRTPQKNSEQQVADSFPDLRARHSSRDLGKIIKCCTLPSAGRCAEECNKGIKYKRNLLCRLLPPPRFRATLWNSSMKCSVLNRQAPPVPTSLSSSSSTPPSPSTPLTLSRFKLRVRGCRNGSSQLALGVKKSKFVYWLQVASSLRGRQPEFRPARIPGLKQVISLRALKVGVVVPELVAKVATGSTLLPGQPLKRARNGLC